MRLTARARTSRRALFYRSLALFGVIAVAVLLLAAGTTKSQAFTPEIIAAKQHFWNCFGLMLTDPAAHVEECDPSAIVPQRDTLASMDGGTPPPTVPEPEDEEKECPEPKYEIRSLSEPGVGYCHCEREDD